MAFISIHAPREGGDCHRQRRKSGPWISIHAPREGGDTFDIQVDDITGISIHAPREGGDLRCKCYAVQW